MTSPTHRALVIVFDGVEEVEALTQVDLLRRAEVEVTVANVNEAPAVTGRNRITFSVDARLDEIDPGAFDLIVLPGGPGVLKLQGNQHVTDMLSAHHRKGAELAALCAAPKILASSGILANHTATSHASVRGDLPHPSDRRVVEDRNVVTSQGVGTAVEFGLALVRRLKGDAVASDIAKSIHH